MYMVHVTIEGTVPLIQGRISDHPDMRNRSGWKERLYISPEGLLYQPSVDIAKCMIAVGGDELKEGFSIQGPHLIFEGLLVHNELSSDPEKPLYFQQAKYPRLVINTGWRLSFWLMITIMDKFPGLRVKDLLNEAGLCVGIGHHTPIYGRFKVVEFDVRESDFAIEGLDDEDEYQVGPQEL